MDVINPAGRYDLPALEWSSVTTRLDPGLSQARATAARTGTPEC